MQILQKTIIHFRDRIASFSPLFININGVNNVLVVKTKIYYNKTWNTSLNFVGLYAIKLSKK